MLYPSLAVMTEISSRLSAALAGRYRVEREVGSGGMATVYLAEDIKHGRKVAVKVLRPELAAVLGAERFLREVQIAAQIEHPHILTLIDSGEADGLLYYVMPFVPGESLRDRLAREGPFPIGDVIRLLRDVADGLAEAHRQGLVHRDVKPDNVLISGRHAVVADFGVAKAVTSATGTEQLTTAGVTLGTPAYMAPEQVAADPSIDHRTDIYALGAMAYELLTGHPPFTGAKQQEVLAAHLTEDPEPITGTRPDTPPELANLVMRCLEKKSEDRWQDTDEIVQRLESMTTPSAGVPSMRLSASRAPGSRPRWMRYALLVVPLLAVSAILLLMMQRQSAAVNELRNRLEPAADSGQLDEAYAILAESDIALSVRGLRDVAHIIGGTIHIQSDPPGAAVRLTRMSSPERVFPPTSLGESPIRDQLVVAGDYVATVERAGYEPLVVTVGVGVDDTVSLVRTLVSQDWNASRMVYVEEGLVVGPVADQFTGQSIPAFLIDRYEVSNEDFQAFVADGGYGNPDLWPDSLLMDDRFVPWVEAMAHLVDRSGLPGPRDWSGGMYAGDRAQHPVTGVSWYEAQAYARWAGKQLPSLAQWWRAALGDADQPYPWGGDHTTLDVRSNFSMTATSAVDGHLSGASPYGAFDMAGNVREWLAGSANAVRYPAIGGSWQDPTYMFYTPNIDRFPPGYANEAIGFRLVKDVPDSPSEED